jgi:pimeloyl-ACP methyl ester carboxylesterase
MNTLPTTTTPAQPQPALAFEPRGPIARIVVGSVLVGLFGALLLTLVVFGGAQEHIITGSAMLAFGFGWAMLAGLSTRLTNQPQRWALVPAAFMGLVGLGLLISAPGDKTLNALGWVWPPAVLVLAIWMAIKARRALRSRTRPWLLYPIFVVLALASVGGAFQTVHAATTSTPAMPGKAYNVDGHRMHLQCTGAGGPTVVLLGGSGEDAASWAWITADVAQTTRVCAYDRPGQGWSEASTRTPDGVRTATDLHTLLQVAHVPGPYVLAGHSVGGPYAMAFALRYPTDVAGMVLLDSSTPRQMTAIPSYPTFYKTYRRISAIFPSLARIGVGHIAFHSAGATLPRPARTAERAFATDARSQRTQRDEFAALPAAFRQAQALRSLGAKPLVVITASQKQKAGWFKEQDRMATLSSNTVHRTVNASHESLLADKSDSAYSSRAIRSVVEAVRTSTAVTLP